MAFVTVKNKNGDTQRVPEHWIGHPVLGAGFDLIEPASSISEPEPAQKKTRGRKAADDEDGGHEDA